MSTITKEFTKEQLQQIEAAAKEVMWPVVWSEKKARKHFSEKITPKVVLKLARIALASLEAEPAIHRWRRVTSEPYGPYPWHYGDFIGFSKPVDGIEDEYFFSAPPEPANAEPVAWLWSHRKHPSEVSIVRPEDDDRAEGAHWSGWSCQALYAAPPAPAAMKDHQIRELVNELRNIAVEYHGTEQLRERIARTIRAAMLQGADGNSPIIPDCWCRTCRPITLRDMRFVVCPDCGNKRCQHANDHRNACTGSNEPGQEGSAYPAAPQQEVK